MNQTYSINTYRQQLSHKTNLLTQILTEFKLPKLMVYSSPISHYRMRAEFRMWHEGDALYHIMYDKETKKRIIIDQLPTASTLINKVMQAIIPLMQFDLQLRQNLFQIDYLVTLNGQILVTLLYHKKLTGEWTKAATKLKQTLCKQGFKLNIVGRAAKQKVLLDVNYVDEQLTVFDKQLTYRQIENSFTQPNTAVNIKMLEWAISATKGFTGDLLEFYCGNGNFSIALAQNFRRVLATEISKVSVRAAQHNIAVNNINNLDIIRLSAEEFATAINKEREFNRLEGIDLDEYQCETVLVDPPRGGIDDKTLDILSAYQNIIYISCNPQSLRDNLQTLCKTHNIKQIALFDQFPYTEHIETGVLLTKIIS